MKKTCSGVSKALTPSRGFRQLLLALSAEHEREVAELLAEVQRLHSVKGDTRADLESCVVDDFSAVVPCVPFLGSARRGISGSRRGGSSPVAQAFPLKEEEVAAPAAPALPLVRAPSCEAKGNGEASDSLPSRMMKEAKVWPFWESALASGSRSTQDSASEKLWLEAVNANDLRGGGGAERGAAATKQEARSRFHLPLNPTSKVKMAWDLCAPFALLYDFVMIPMQVFTLEETLGKQVIEGLILLYWVCDMIISFNSAYINETAEIVESYRLIAIRYFRTWFFPDFAITGCDVVNTSISWLLPADSATSQNVHVMRLAKFLRVTRIVRILRFGRVAKLHEVMYRIQLYFDSEAIAIAWGLCLNIFTLLVLNHVTACLWYWIGSSDQEYTWLKAPVRADYTYADLPLWEAYFVSLHWSLTLFTPASMSVQPENLQERVYAVVCLMLAMVVFASFVSTVTAGTTRLRHLHAENVEQGYMLRKFLTENHVSHDLVARVARYVDIAMKCQKKLIPITSVKRLHWLSGPLHVELMWELSSPTLRAHPFFERYQLVSMSAMRQLCSTAITVHPVSKRDTVFSSYGEAARMYFVKVGHLVYKRAKGLKFPRRVELVREDWFVEQVLWIKWVHRGTLKAVTESDLTAVESNKFREVAAGHPDVLSISAEYAYTFAAKVGEKSTCDIPQQLINQRAGPNSTTLPSVTEEVTFSSESDIGIV